MEIREVLVAMVALVDLRVRLEIRTVMEQVLQVEVVVAQAREEPLVEKTDITPTANES